MLSFTFSLISNLFVVGLITAAAKFYLTIWLLKHFKPNNLMFSLTSAEIIF